ncbi:MAG: hypothetical protein QXI12_13520 [Candidatus Methanomethyliaceae archaeon]
MKANSIEKAGHMMGMVRIAENNYPNICDKGADFLVRDVYCIVMGAE